MSSPIVAFVTIFLSLTMGVHPVEVLVGDGVERVEIWLDYELVGSMSGPEWSLDTDFGGALEPHHLEAVAFDAEGKELAREEQWVNLPSPTAEAFVVIDRAPSGEAWVRLTWENVMGDDPERVSVSLDGQALDVTDPARVPLPPHDPEQLHFLRAELEFAHNVSVVKEHTFGGSYGDELNTELTALPVRVSDKRGERRLPGLDVLQDWFVSGNVPARVAAIDEGPAEITIVRDRATQERLDRLAAGHQLGNRFVAALGKEQKLAFFWPFMVRAPSGHWTFPAPLGWMSAQDGGVPWFLATMPSPAPPDGRQLLADAVAVAGMNSLTRNRRRAVVLILGQEPQDESYLSPAVVRRYLEALRVPLYVWSPHKGVTSDWGEVRDVSTMGKFRAAVSELARDVDRQRIIWLQGKHLPQRIRLTEQAEAISFPG